MLSASNKGLIKLAKGASGIQGSIFQLQSHNENKTRPRLLSNSRELVIFLQRNVSAKGGVHSQINVFMWNVLVKNVFSHANFDHGMSDFYLMNN